LIARRERPVHFIALLGCAPHTFRRLQKLFDFNAAIAETQSSTPFGSSYRATIVTELAGSALILTESTAGSAPCGLRDSRSSQRSLRIDFGKWSQRNASCRELVLRAPRTHRGFLLIAWLDLRKSDGASN